MVIVVGMLKSSAVVGAAQEFTAHRPCPTAGPSTPPRFLAHGVTSQLCGCKMKTVLATFCGEHRSRARLGYLRRSAGKYGPRGMYFSETTIPQNCIFVKSEWIARASASISAQPEPRRLKACKVLSLHALFMPCSRTFHVLHVVLCYTVGRSSCRFHVCGV